MEVRRLAVIGTGLIGASVALAAKRAGLTEVVGYDHEPQAVARGGLKRSGQRPRPLPGRRGWAHTIEAPRNPT